MNQDIEAYLRLYCADHPEDWDNHLTDLEFAHNQKNTQGRNASPFMIMMGYDPWAIPEVTKNSKSPFQPWYPTPNFKKGFNNFTMPY